MRQGAPQHVWAISGPVGQGAPYSRLSRQDGFRERLETQKCVQKACTSVRPSCVRLGPGLCGDQQPEGIRARPSRVVQDKWVDSTGSVCLRQCRCPADGAACALDGACDEGSFACKPGFARMPGEQRCFLEGCQEGSLQV